jgi:hypothetical protein
LWHEAGDGTTPTLEQEQTDMIATTKKKAAAPAKTSTVPSLTFWIDPIALLPEPWVPPEPEVGAHMFGKGGLLDPVG